MPSALLILLVLSVGGAVGAFIVKRKSRQLERERFIRQYVFSRTLLDALRKTYPSLEERDTFLVARALRCYFLVHLRTAPALVAMPSRVVDGLWHEFVLDTRAYQDFCSHAFGAFFHHVPASSMKPGVSKDTALRRTWRHACLEENINPHAPARLPLLFAIDAKLHIPDGSHYSLTRPPEAASDPSYAAGCGGFACAGDGLAGDPPSCGGGVDGGSSGDGGGDCGGGCGGD